MKKKNKINLTKRFNGMRTVKFDVIQMIFPVFICDLHAKRYHIPTLMKETLFCNDNNVLIKPVMIRNFFISSSHLSST